MYKSLLKELYSLSSMGIKLGIDRVKNAAAALGNPQDKFNSILVGGTNGKGSVCTMLAHGLTRCGLKTGLFTSPHLHRFTERIKIDNEEICEEKLIPQLNRVLELLKHGEHNLTFFEVATLTAFCVFAEQKIDLAVLEVGLGGRLDATNIVSPCACAIVTVGLDHTKILGNSIGEIAYEKAGIIKSDTPLITGPLPPEALEVIEKTAKENNARHYKLGKHFYTDSKLILPWPGKHQLLNAAVACQLASCTALNNFPVDEIEFKKSLKSTRWPGRFEILNGPPEIILDGAHNLEAILALKESLLSINIKPKVLLFGALKDKPADTMLEMLRPLVETIVIVPPPIKRGKNPKDYAGSNDITADDIKDGLAIAKKLCSNDETILVTGSIFTVADARKRILKIESDPYMGL